MDYGMCSVVIPVYNVKEYLLKKGRHAVYLQKSNRRILKMLIWELLFAIKIITCKVV